MNITKPENIHHWIFLLDYLKKHPDEVFSQEDLTDILRIHGFNLGVNTVWKFIHKHVPRLAQTRCQLWYGSSVAIKKLKTVLEGSTNKKRRFTKI